MTFVCLNGLLDAATLLLFFCKLSFCLLVQLLEFWASIAVNGFYWAAWELDEAFFVIIGLTGLLVN